MSHTVEQNELVAEAVAGDRVSLERLLLIYYSPLSQRIAAKLPPTVRGAVAADDVLQQTFIQVFRDIGSFRPRAGASFWSWLKTIADHRVYDAVRTARRKKRGGDAAPA
jgi:RNA polymerase sigma factor (sigma-70 family)